MRTTYMLGNWKMNQSVEEVISFCSEIANSLPNSNSAKFGVAPQSLHLQILKDKAPQSLLIGAQNCAEHLQGAYTGEISPSAIRDFGANFTLIGHSERRQIYGETDKQLNTKLKLALGCGLTAVFCIGETLEERDAGSTEAVLKHQLIEGLKDVAPTASLIIAYEPVWAIGTGKTATPEMAQETHAFVRQILNELGHDAASTSILYGGSVKPDNVAGLLACPDIDGGLVGGASLKAGDFSALCHAAANA